jgi:hypothetical protein
VITQRILPPEEWSRLNGTESEKLWPRLNPENAQVVAVEEDGELVASWVLLRVVHAECIWVKPSHRGIFGVVKRLLGGMRTVAAGWGADRVITGSISPDVTDLIARFGGYPMPCESYVLPIDKAGTKRTGDRQLGRDFHAQLEAQLPEDNHPGDPEHDEHVGRALRTALRVGDPKRAESEYNAWARPAGYEPISFLSGTDGKVRADIASAVIEIDDQFRVTVLKEEPCLS